MKFRILALAALLFAACENAGGDLGGILGGSTDIPLTVTATTNDANLTRSAFYENVHFFEQGDEAALCFTDEVQRWKYTGIGMEKRGIFAPTEIPDINAKRTLSEAVMVYPYNSNVTINTANSTIGIYMPPMQVYTPNSYDPNATIMYGLSEGSEFELTSICGWYRIQLPNSMDVDYITLRSPLGEQLSGNAEYNYAEGTFKFQPSPDGDSVTLDCRSREATSDADVTDYYIALAPQNYADGLVIELTMGDGSTSTMEYLGGVSIESNTITSARNRDTWTSLGMGSYYDDFLAPIYSQPAGKGVYVEVCESVTREGIYALKNPFTRESVVQMLGGAPTDMIFAEEDIYLEIDVANPNSVVIPFQYVGISINGFGQVYIGMVSQDYGKFENGVITFPERCLGLVNAEGIGMCANMSGLFRVVFPGYDTRAEVVFRGNEVVDEEAFAAFDIQFGVDVSECRYVIVEGDAPITHFESTGFFGGEEVYHDAILEMMDGNYSGAYPHGTMSPNDTELIIKGLEPRVYTLFALPFGISGVYSEYDIVSVPFYFRGNTVHEDLPDLNINAAFSSVSEQLGDEYEVDYPSSSVLLLTLSLDNPEDYKTIGQIQYLWRETAAIEEYLQNGETMDHIFEVMGMYIDPVSLRTGGMQQFVFSNLEPNTSYTVMMRIESGYGKVHELSFTASTAPIM